MNRYEKSDVPGNVLVDGVETDALEEIETLSERLLSLEDENADLETELNSRPVSRTDETLASVERIVDRIRYACSEEAEKAELKALLSLFSPDASRYVGLVK